ncbi:hypothetical protein ACKWRH_21540 [Bradyrhizobium sp. Pa8]|uniref:hypothetical protein n=1 Tax=Bradyrhizobium sp. Pa8 TaxID=3386552 RepID=UPI00403F05C5
MDDQANAGEGIAANVPATGEVQIGGDPNAPQRQLSVAEVETKRNAENLERAKAGGYVEQAPPTISERVASLIAAVGHSMENNAPISRENFEEMKALLGHRGQALPDQTAA